MMNSEAHKKPDVGRICEIGDADRPYVLLRENKDAIYSTGKQIIADSQFRISLDDWSQEFDTMMEYVIKWVKECGRPIKSWTIIGRGAKLNMFFCPNTKSFDFDLAERLADLNMHLVRNFRIGPIEISQIPWSERDRFIGPDMDMLNGNVGATHSSVGA